MSTHYVRVGAVEHTVSIEGDAITFDGSPLSAEIAPLGGGVFSLLLDGESIRVVLSGEGDRTALCSGITGEVALESPRSRLLKQFGGIADEAHRQLEIRAPMPALVVRIEVEVGQRVAQGEGLIVLEAMKMENELNAPHAGTVKEILVEKGRSVEKGALLVRLG